MSRTSLVAVLVAAVLGTSACSKDPEVAKREYLRSGDGYAAGGQYHEAIVEYRNAVQQDPLFAEARRKLADAYVQTGDLPSAAREYVRAADLLPDDVALQIMAGNMLLILGEFSDAQGRADKVLARMPTHVEAQILRANALAGLKRLDDAIAEVEAAIESDPTRSASYANLGTIQMVRGDRERAEIAFRRAVELDEQSVPARLALTNFFLGTGRTEEAEAQLKAALELEPGHLLTNRVLGYLYLGSGRGREAEPYLKVVAEAAPDEAGKLALADYYVMVNRAADARRLLEEVGTSGNRGVLAASKLRLASLALSAGDTAGATSLVDEVLSAEPSNADALSARAEILSQSGRLDEALSAARQAVAASPQSANAQFALGRVLSRRRETVDATTAFTQALALNPRMATAEVELARLHLAAGRLNEAEHFARSAARRLAGDASLHLLLARISTLRGDTATAEPSLRVLERLFPDSAAVQTELALLQLTRNDRAAARAAFLKALEADPLHAEALSGLTRMDVQDRRFAAARSRVDDAVARRPGDARLLTIAGTVHAATGDAGAAERLLLRALEADAGHLDAYASLAQIYVSQQRLDQATAQYRAIVERQPKSVAAVTTVGVLEHMQNRTAEARASYERALQIDPNAPVAANNLAWIYAEENTDLPSALRLAEIAKSRLPDQPEVSDTLGWVLHKRGQSLRALPHLQFAVEKDPRNASYHYHLGAAYGAAGETARARAALERSIALDPASADANEARRLLAGLEG